MSARGGQRFRSTAVFAGGTLFSRLLGMVRDIVLAGFIPAFARDAFFLAFRLTNMLRDLVGEGAMNAAFVPVFSSRRAERGETEFRETVGAVFGVMVLLLGVLTGLGVWFAPQLVQGINSLEAVTGSTRDPAAIDLAAALVRWTFPYLFFIGLAVFAMAPLFAMKRYAVASWSPALLNIAIVVSVLCFHYIAPGVLPSAVWAVVVGVWLGGVAQLAALYVAMGRAAGVWRPRFHPRHPGVREALVLMGPVILGQAAGEVNKLVDAFFAYSLPAGTVTALFYANRLVQLPLSVFAIATAAVVLPAISAACARDEPAEARDELSEGVRQTLFLALPSALGLVALGTPIVRLLFEWGAFTAAETARTAAALAWLAPGLLGFSLVKVLVTGFYGARDTRTPVLVSTASMLLNILLNVLLVAPLGFRGLALATSIAFAANAAALLWLLARRYGGFVDGALASSFVRIAAASSVSAAVAYGASLRIGALFAEDTLTARVAGVAPPLVLAVGAYLGCCIVLGVRETRLLGALMRRR